MSDIEHMQQHLRCYTEIADVAGNDAKSKDRARRQGRRKEQARRARREGRAGGASKGHATEAPEARAIREIERPYGGYCFVLDTETTTDERKALRVGFYAVFGIEPEEKIRLHRAGKLDRAALDRAVTQGVFYDPHELTPAEIAVVTQWAHDKGIRCLPVRAFVKDVFYHWASAKKEAVVIGHNLAYDLTRLATKWGAAKDGYRGGFWLKLCDCAHDDCFKHPVLRIKHIGAAKNLYGFRGVMLPGKDGQPVKEKYGGRFADTLTLGRALLGPGELDLYGLARRAGVAADKRKARWDGEHGGLITPEYLDYNSRDVYATWELYKQLRGEYRKHGLPNELWHIISEASLGKAIWAAIGIPRFLTQHKDFPKDVIGHAMEAYYGGRSEVHIRLQPVDVIHADFKSEYPTVNALMHLQDLLIAERVDVVDCTNEVRAWLHDHAGDMLTLLQKKETWALLRKLVKIKPNGDILPFRATYGDGQAATNIGQQHVYGLPAWWTLLDALSSMIRTGRVPEIVEAVEVVPIGRVDTQPFPLLSDASNLVDVAHDDLFTALIDRRDELKAEEKRLKKEWRTASGQRYADIDARLAVLDSQQRALKLIANATSYGTLLEIRQDEHTDDPKQVWCYDDTAHIGYTHYVEEPGPYFAGGVGTFIPAAGRLLLAIAERLAADRGVSWAFADTDSMSFARPADMPRDIFMKAVDEITAWFTPLSPYKSSAPIFVKESYNDWGGEPYPLRCLAVSAKRYGLYNVRADGTLRLRKFSAHGTGMWERLTGYTPNRAIDEQHWAHREIDLLYAREDGAKVSECYTNLDELYADRTRGGIVYDNTYSMGGPRWLYDVWHSAIEQVEGWYAGDRGGLPEPHVYIKDNPWLDVVARQQVTFSTAHVYTQFDRRIKDVRPWNFITTYPPLLSSETLQRRLDEVINRDGVILNSGKASAYDGIEGVPFYDSVDENGTPVVRRLDTGAVVRVAHKTLREVMRDYFKHPEWKAGNPRGIGTLERRHIVAVDHVYIGKEMNEVREDENADSDGAIPTPDAQQYARYGLGQAIKAHGVKVVAAAILDVGKKPIAARTLYDYAAGGVISRENIGTLVAAFNRCPPARGCCARADDAPDTRFVAHRADVEDNGPAATAAR